MKYFEQENASSYDEQRAKLAPIKDALHLCIQIILSELAVDARILCVGVGTGAELIHLAQAYPGWQFTVVEPVPEMMKRCCQQAEKHCITSRCTFHEGFIETLSDHSTFDAATSILVSHFIVNNEERIKYFSNIRKFIRSGGYMVNADLCADTLAPDYHQLLNVWVNMHEYAGMPANIDSFGRDVAILSSGNIEEIIVAGGFENPVLCYQALFIRGWFSKVS